MSRAARWILDKVAEIATLRGVTAIVAGTTSCEHLEAAAAAIR